MTRTQLIKITMEELNKPGRTVVRINKCKAFIDEVTPDFYIIVSYNTPVAVYIKTTGTMYVFNFYSRTTTQHIHKAAKILDAMRFTYLYQRSDKYVEIARNGYANSFKPNKKEWQNIIDSDYSLEIGETSILRVLNY